MNTKDGRIATAALALALVVPAAVFFLAAIGRSLQPTTHEPSRTLDAIVTWFGTLPDLAALTLLVVLPFVGLVLAAGFLWRTWTTDPTVRADTLAFAAAAARVARRLPFLAALLVIAFGLLYFAAVAAHAVAG